MSLAAAERPILVAIFLDLLGFGMVVADFQLRAEHLVPAGWPAGAVIGGLLGSTFAIQFVVSPWWGRRSDAVGRKSVLITCTFLSAMAMLVFGLADGIEWLLVSRVFAGLGSANVAVAQAWIADEYEGAPRTAALGRVSAAIGAGLVIGPPLGGHLSEFGGNRAIGLVAGIGSLIGVVWLALAMPKRLPEVERAPGKRGDFGFSLLREIPSLRRLFLIAVVAWFSLAALEGTFARLIERLFGYGQREFGWIFGFEALLGIIVSAKVLGWVAERTRETMLLRGAYLAQGVGLVLNPFAGALPFAAPLVLLFVASTLFATGSSLANPTINAICSRLTPDKRQGELFGLLQGSRGIGFILGPIVGGVLFDMNPIAPYLLAGAVCVVAALLVPRGISLALT